MSAASMKQLFRGVFISTSDKKMEPKNAPYIYTEKWYQHIIDLQQFVGNG